MRTILELQRMQAPAFELTEVDSCTSSGGSCCNGGN